MQDFTTILQKSENRIHKDYSSFTKYPSTETFALDLEVDFYIENWLLNGFIYHFVSRRGDKIERRKVFSGIKNDAFDWITLSTSRSPE